MKPWIKTLLWLSVIVAAVAIFWRAFEPTPTLVDVATIEAGPMQLTLDDDGHTQVRERYTVSAPSNGRLVRPALKAGSPVDFDETVLFEWEPLASEPLDERSRAQAEAQVQRAASALLAASARVERAEAQWTFARANLKRRETLEASGYEAQQDFDLAQREERMAAQDLNAARYEEQIARWDQRLAELALLDPTAAQDEDRKPIPVLSPMTGHVIRVFEASARTVSAGTPILEVGDTSSLEIVADYLSQDAVKVQPGMPVRIEGWGGEALDGSEQVLHGAVRWVEPGAFTKISALGVEEQRINIIVDPADMETGWPELADGYRAELHIVTWDQPKILFVPTGALFRVDEHWAVFVVQEGRVQQRIVELGHRNGLQAEILEGLQRGEQVVLYPSELVEDGNRVEVRE